MAILNLMLGKKRGGLEQAALDYAQVMAWAGIPCLTVTSPGAWLAAQLVSANLAHESLASRGNWDVFASLRLRELAKRSNATTIICHGNRALVIGIRALQGRVPVIAVAHNYSTRRFGKADGCFAITQHLKEHLARSGVRTITLMPNMTRIPEGIVRTEFRTPPIIGGMGRLVVKKGFKSFVEALSLLRARGISFRAVIGGEGEEAASIEALIARYHLQDVITCTGWVKNKRAFFESLDLFVLPSLHEPFGIVLIEAMSHGVPVISTDAEGPREIIHSKKDGVLVARGDPVCLADAMEVLLANPAEAARLGSEGAKLIAEHYSMDAMAERLKTVFAALI